MRVSRFFVIIFFAISINLLGCKKDDIADTIPYHKSTTLFILEANNSLRQEALQTINEIELGYHNSEENIVLVYVKSESSRSVLLRIRNDNDLSLINSDTIEVFYNEQSTAELIGRVAQKSQLLFPADSYALILWSHSTSWYPAKTSITTKSFGDDNGIDMDITDLAAHLPKNYKYIIFDSCNMASVEVLYEFKDNCSYILASPSEVIAPGFPYRNAMNYIVEGNLERIATQYFEYYYSFIGPMQSATVSLIDSKELNKLARALADILLTKEQSIFNNEDVQRMDFTLDFPVTTYDFGSYLKNNFNIQEYNVMRRQLEKVVLFKRNTPYFFGQEIKEFSGLTCYIPEKDVLINSRYKKLKWVIDSTVYKFI